MNTYVFHIRIILIVTIFTATISNSLAQSSNNEVVPIDKSRFSYDVVDDPVLNQWQTLLTFTCEEVLNNWWNSIPDLKDKNGKTDKNDFIDFGYLENNNKKAEFGKETKGGIRDAAEYAYTLAVLIFTDSYEASMIDLPKSVIIQRTTQIIKSLAKDHKINGGINHPWGDQWQSAQWAGKVAVAGWLMWEYLDKEAKNNVTRMIEYEANRFLNNMPPYANGNYIFNTMAEEVGWNATALQTACAMLPNHSNYNAWLEKSYEHRLAAVAMPTDLENESLVEGKKVKDRVSGYNMDTLGALGNHFAYPHPDYMAATLRHSIEGALFLQLGGQSVPLVNTFNCSRIYDNFNDYAWYGDSTIYKKDGAIYWPIGIETKRRFELIKYSLIDLGAQILGFDETSSLKGEYWEEIHLAKAIELKRTEYLSASGYLLKWMLYSTRDK
ncbi:hypothetical protein ACE01N_04225 [Saccharicrinis sp. FJH2]|uniref:hypothetical protein n=1 Tax=Saccharicrinis sp. FJH65 TaxID=3344659 RepID=UPI0035F2E3BA